MGIFSLFMCYHPTKAVFIIQVYEGPVQQRSGRGEHRLNHDQSAGGDGDAPAGADPASDEGRHLLGRSAVYLTEGLVVEHPLLH